MTRPRLASCVAALPLAIFVGTALAQEVMRPRGPNEVGAPAVPTVTIAVRDLPDWTADPNTFGLEMQRREDYGFIPIPYPVKPKLDPLFDEQQQMFAQRSPDAFSTLVHNFAGQTTGSSPPDTTGDVGLDHFVQAVNASVSTVRVLNKTTGATMKTFTMASLTAVAPCSSGFCDPGVLYDRVANRWIISELPSAGGSTSICVYVSTTPDPTGTFYAYTFPIETSIADYPKYGVWPQGVTGGSYLVGVNAGSGGNRDIIALDRGKMLLGQPATFQKFSVPGLPNSGFELVLPSNMQGPTAPPDGERAVFMRPRDDEAQTGSSTPTDTLELWGLLVDWATPANSQLTTLPSIPISDYDMTLCGMGSTWNCMPQPGTTQKIDPIREPLQFPLQYRNFGAHQTMVGTFPVDVDGTDHAGMRWFEVRKTGAGNWVLHQEGLVGGEANVHRAVGSIAMDGSQNIAMAYTRTGTVAPYYPSLYYKGRIASDPVGTMPQGEFVIQDATNSKTNNERWGDYAGIGIDPVDDCTFWFTSQYGGSGQTRVAAFKFDECGCLAVPPAPEAAIAIPQDNHLEIAWDDSSTSSIVSYLVYRATQAGGPYTLLTTIPDSSPGTGGGAGYTYDDGTVSGGSHYYYIVRSSDGVSCLSGSSNEVDAVATGACILAPFFGGAVSVSNPLASTCTLNVTWNPGTAACGGPLTYNVYRDTAAGFTPSPANRVATGLAATTFSDGVGIVGGTTYRYIVRTVDGSNGLEDANTVERIGMPTGPPVSYNWSDSFEGAQSGGGFDLPGWTTASLSGTSNWAWTTARKHDGTHSWRAPDSPGVNDKVLVSPPFGVGPSTTLGFFHTYQFDGAPGLCYDGGTLEYTTNGGASWTVVPAGDFTAGAYNGTVHAVSGNPIGGKPAWCVGSISTMVGVMVNLGSDFNMVNRTVQIRWHEGDNNNAVSALGWFVDAIAVTNAQTGGACEVGTGVLTVGNDGPVCNGGALQLTASYSQAGLTFAWTGPDGFTSNQQNPSIVPATAAAAGTYTVNVMSGASTVASDTTDAVIVADGGACEDANPCTAGDLCGAGVCVPGSPAPPPGLAEGVAFSTTTSLSWNPVAGATGYDVVRGSLSVLRSGGFTPAVDVCPANDIASTSITSSHVPDQGEADWFLIRASSTCGVGSYGDGTQIGPRDPAIGASGNTCP